MSVRARIGLVLWLWLGLLVPALAGSLLPNGEQTFVDQNGQPYAGGKVYFYIPNTLTPKTTWSDSGQTSPNTNPVVLDSAGRAVIYGVGAYRQILKDVFGNTIWDKLTQGIGSGGQIVNGEITGNTTIAQCNGIFPINNGTNGDITVTLPASPSDGDSCQFFDVGNNASVYKITLALNGNVLNTGANFYAMDYNAMALTLTWVASANSWTVN